MEAGALLLFLFLVEASSARGSGAYRLTAEPKDVAGARGSTVTLQCGAPGSTAILNWRHAATQPLDEVPFIDFRHDRYRKRLSDGSLELRLLGEGAPAGDYQCIVDLGDVGTVISRVATVTIPSLPGFEAEPHDLNVYPGEAAFFACAVRGSYSLGSLKPRGPRMQFIEAKPSNLMVQWLRNDAPLRLDESRMTLMPSGALEIDSVNRQDHGFYRCNVSLIGGSGYRLSNKAQLNVKTDLSLAETVHAPKFIAEPRSQTVIEGSSVTMDCAALGNPRPQIIWLNNGVKIDLEDLDSRFFLLGFGVLFISSVQEADAGTYQCRADNTEDSLDATAVLDVQVPPRFIKRPIDVKALEREDLELECEVYGKPDPSVRWLKNGEIIIPNNHDMTLVNGYNLRIQGLMPTDAGIFQCVAFNLAGNIQSSARLVVTTTELEDTEATKDPIGEGQVAGAENEDSKLLPSEPLDLRAVIIKPRFVTLSWSEPLITNGDIEAYLVIYKVSSLARERMMNTTRKGVHEINVSQLQPNTAYQFRVVPYNKNGPGPSTQLLEITTQSEDQSLGPPKDLNVTLINPTTINVSWQPPHPIPGARMSVDKYQLFWSEIVTGEEKSIITADLYQRLTELKPFTDYAIRVVALAAGAENDSAEGAGAPTDQIFIKTPGDSPSASPLNITLEAQTSTSISVHWEAPPLETRNGDITGYKIKYRKTGRKKANSLTTAADAREVTLKELDQMASYQVRICAFNVNGSGPFTEWYHVETLQNDLDESRVPYEPSPLKTRAGVDSILVYWAPPKNQNVKIRGYRIAWGKGVPDVYFEVVSESIKHYTIRNLEQNSEYVISLRASNQMGDGPPVYANVRTLDKLESLNEDDVGENVISKPGRGPIAPNSAPLIPPVGLKAEILSGTKAVVYWTDATLPKLQIVTDQRYYIVRYCSIGSQRHRYVNITHLNCMIDELRPNTQYEFTVKVVKGIRESPWSMVVTNTTLETPPASYPRELRISPNADGSPNSLTLNWLPPTKANGVVTGYVILYTTDWERRDRDWVVQAVVGGGTFALVRSLKPSTAYHFKVQARNAKGYGPFSPMVTFTTLPGNGMEDAEMSVNNREGRQNHSLIIYIIIGAVGVFIVIGVIITAVICCRKINTRPPTSPESRGKSTYQKSSASNIKPPDLWIHHDQMELKQMDKSHHSSTGSADGSGMSAMTLPRPPPPRDSCEYETAMPGGGSLHSHPPTGSLDKRHYVPTYVAMSSINTCNINPGTNESLGSAGIRSMYPRNQYNLGSNTRTHVNVDQNTPLLSAAGSSMSGTLPSQSSMSSLGQIGATLPLHHSLAGSMGISPMSCSQASCGIGTSGSILQGPAPSSSPSPASDGFPADAREREQGHYVAYEALHLPRDSLDGSSGIGSLGRTHSGSTHPLRSFSVPAPPPSEAPHTPHHHSKVSVTIRPTNTSPYKKPLIPSNTTIPTTVPGGSMNRLQQGLAVPHSAEELEALAPSHSTERLHQEMANLEGLMKDLNAITASQFEC